MFRALVFYVAQRFRICAHIPPASWGHAACRAHSAVDLFAVLVCVVLLCAPFAFAFGPRAVGLGYRMPWTADAGGAGGAGNRRRGVASRWNEKGFTFIRPDDGSEEVFAHSSGIKDGNCIRDGYVDFRFSC